MRKNYILKTFQFLVFVFSAFPVFSQQYNSHTFTAHEGLPQLYIYAITQDKSAHLWIGTGNGLSRYNGFNFENFTTKDSLADNFITGLISEGNNLWVGHMNGKISFFDGTRFYPLDVSVKNEPVFNFTPGFSGNIWAATYSKGLIEIKDKSQIIKHSFPAETNVSAFAFCGRNQLIVGTLSGLMLARISNRGNIEIVKKISEIPSVRISAICKSKHPGLFYVATSDEGVFSFNIQGNKVSKVYEGLTGIQDIFEDRQSNLWLGTFGQGVVKLTPSSGGYVRFHLGKEGSFPVSNVKTFFEDREGNFWSGNYGEGLTRITARTFSDRIFDVRYGNNILAIAGANNFQWIATSRGIIKQERMSDKVVNFYGKGTCGLPNDDITSVYSSNINELWVGYEKSGLYKLDSGSGRFKKIALADGDLENSVNTIYGKAGKLWVGTKKGLCCINPESSEKTWYTNKDGMPHNYINGIYVDSSDKVWVTTRSGSIAYIDKDRVFKLGITSGFSFGPIAEDNSNRIWIGSLGNGVYLIEGDSIINLNTKNGLSSDYCYSLIHDKNNNMWVGHKGGLSKIKTDDLLVQSIKSFNGTENFNFNNNAVSIDHDQKIWFGTDKSLIIYDPSLETNALAAPIPFITAIWVNDKKTETRKELLLPPGRYNVRISFLGINLKAPDQVSYQYKLEGYDDWSEITRQTSVTYTALTEGEYKFILKASTGEGIVTGQPLEFLVVISKPLWKRWWFYPAIVLLIFGFSALYIKRREVNFITEKRILEEKVLERTHEISSQKKEIELQHNAIKVINSQITSSIAYASHIQNAVLPPVELIDRLLPDNFILNKPKDIVSGDFFWIAESDGKIIFTVADCTGHGVPGAFMSLLGITLLNEIVKIMGIHRPDAIVSKLRERLIHSLQQDRKEITISDGMEICLCVLDKQRKKLQYTGGMNDLVYVRNGKLEVVKSDRFSVCLNTEVSRVFSLKEIDVKEGDVFYLFSDGFKDQFGGESDKKFLVRRFYKTLLEIHSHPMRLQKEMLEQKLLQWMGSNEQTDDIMVMGVKIQECRTPI